MDLDWQIRFAARLLYFVAAVSVAHVLTGGLINVTWILGSGIADIGVAIYYVGWPVLGVALELFAIGAFAVLGYQVQHKAPWAMLVACAFVLIDGLLAFGLIARGGLVAAGVGLPASFLVVFHGIVFWCVVRAFGASRQQRINEFVVHRLELEAELKRKLEQSDAPAPPAATFTRYGSAPRT